MPLTILILTSCDFRPDELEPKEYLQWRSENADEFTQSKEFTDFLIMAEYLEPQFLALIEKESSSETKAFNEIYDEYKCGLTFNLSFKVKGKLNLLQKNITSVEDYNHRIYILSYKMDEFITLKVEDEKLKPALYNYEGHNELNNKINFRVVFVPESKSCQDLQSINSMILTIDDQVWETGITTFTFEGDAIQNFPEVKSF